VGVVQGGKVGHVRVRLPVEHAYLVEQREQSCRLLLYKVHARLVVLKLNVCAVDPFGRVVLLLRNEDSVVEERLRLLVRIVDAELLKTVNLEDLETEDVQNSDEVLR